MAAADRFSMKLEHSHSSRYILSPLEMDLWRVILLNPTDLGR
uniref:Uncharacterized protein n=1 Tax=Timema cristinae TaxID=61476 RepID=A0A7R9DGP4_TIMCR|nr:unnamed protein product [Timema cristinae]